MSSIKIGDRVELTIKPAFGEPRQRDGEVFAVERDTALAQVRAPGDPQSPYTVKLDRSGETRF